MTEKVEKKTEVVKLAENLPPEERARLEETLSQVDTEVAKQTEADATEGKAPEADDEASPCQRCGWQDGQGEPTPADMREYTRSILGSRPFTKTYELMQGQIKLTFISLDGATSEVLNSHILGIKTEDPLIYNTALAKVRLLYYARGVKLGVEETIPFSVPENDTELDIDKLFIERFGKLPESVVSMVTRSLNLFRGLEAALMSKAFDENFWTGAGPC